MKKIALFLLLSGILALPIVASDMNDLLKSYPPKSITEKQTEHNSLFLFYDEYISPVDGERCQMSPSCSVYSRNAIQAKGYLRGIMMSFDRLLRCGYDLKTYPRRYEAGLERYWDPVDSTPQASL